MGCKSNKIIIIFVKLSEKKTTYVIANIIDEIMRMEILEEFYRIFTGTLILTLPGMGLIIFLWERMGSKHFVSSIFYTRRLKQ